MCRARYHWPGVTGCTDITVFIVGCCLLRPVVETILQSVAGQPDFRASHTSMAGRQVNSATGKVVGNSHDPGYLFSYRHFHTGRHAGPTDHVSDRITGYSVPLQDSVPRLTAFQTETSNLPQTNRPADKHVQHPTHSRWLWGVHLRKHNVGAPSRRSKTTGLRGKRDTVFNFKLFFH